MKKYDLLGWGSKALNLVFDWRYLPRCPVYKTQQRGPTYVFDAGLKTKAPTAKWVLAGVVLMMDVA